jgi:hypothetical protein
MAIEERLNHLGLSLPDGPAMPQGLSIPFAWVRVRGGRAMVSGHGALTPDGSPAGPFGKVPGEVTLEEAQQSAVGALLAILSSLRVALGSLDRVAAWLMVNAFVNAEPGYRQTTICGEPLIGAARCALWAGSRDARPYRDRCRLHAAAKYRSGARMRGSRAAILQLSRSLRCAKGNG